MEDRDSKTVPHQCPSVFLDSLGPHEELPSVAEELRDVAKGRAAENKANWVLRKLGRSID